MTHSFAHTPVLLHKTLDYLKPTPTGVYVDCTLGGGGHAEALLELAGTSARLVGIDRDPEAIAAAGSKLARFGAQVDLLQGNFRNLDQLLTDAGYDSVDGIIIDLGVSSHQLDEPKRGFSYWGEALDMRMGPDARRSAADLVNELDENELTRIIREYGEERWAARIARVIAEKRSDQPIVTATQLVDLIKAAIPAAARRNGPHPARRTFQAIRIAVNDELNALQDVLEKAVGKLGPGGRLVVISFHSLEDRIVKRFMQREARGCICPPELPICTCGRTPRLKILTRKPVVADRREQQENPRARSAKLRAAERVLAERESE